MNDIWSAVVAQRQPTISVKEGQKKGGTQASAKEAGNKPTLSAMLPVHCLPTWVKPYFLLVSLASYGPCYAKRSRMA